MDTTETTPAAITPPKEELDGRVLALVQRAARQGEAAIVGAAYYDPELNCISVLGRTVALGNGYECILRAIIDQCEPKYIVFNSRATDSFGDAMEKVLAKCDKNIEFARRLSSAAFEKSSTIRRLEEVGFSKISLGSLIDVGDDLGAIGGVLHLVQKSDLLPENSLTKIELINLDDYMMTSLESLYSLDVVKEEHHPSIVRCGTKHKEGFSLITLLDRVKSVLGRRTLRKWILQPLANVEMIQERLDCVEYLNQAWEVNGLLASIMKSLSGLRDVVRILYLIRKRTVVGKDWVSFAESISAIDEVMDHLKMLVEKTNLLGIEPPELIVSMLDSNTGTLQNVIKGLGVIDWADTKELGHLVPVEGVSAELDRARQQYKAVDRILDKALQRVQTTYGEYPISDHLEPTYIPILGFLINVSKEHLTGDYVTELLPPGFQEQFTRNDDPSDALVYFKCALTEQLNERFGDLYGNVRDMEMKVARDLETLVMSFEQNVLRGAYDCADLDVLISFSSTAVDFDYVRPEFVDQNIIEIKDGMHPLQMHNTDQQCIPNDVTLGGQNEHSKDILLLTGPTYSGKSILLKTVAVLTIMAQVGCFVPAKEFKLGIVDRIFTRIGTLESSAVLMESSFSRDVQQIKTVIQNYTTQSLLIIDEFGKGTITTNGASLLVATLKELCKSESHIPRTVCATHFHEILDCNLLQNYEHIITGEMQVILNEDDVEITPDYSEESLDIPVPIPMFKLLTGSRATNSYGLVCAKRANVPISVIRRAKTILDLGTHGINPSSDLSRDEAIAKVFSKPDSFWTEAPPDQIRQILELIAASFKRTA